MVDDILGSNLIAACFPIMPAAIARIYETTDCEDERVIGEICAYMWAQHAVEDEYNELRRLIRAKGLTNDTYNEKATW